MIGEQKVFETNRQLAALRQIDAAIRLFAEDEFECATTLAAAAEGLLPHTARPYVFTLLKSSPDFRNIDFNHLINWLKHSKDPDGILLFEFEVAMVVVRAISKYIAAYRVASKSMSDFVRWAFDKGHLPWPEGIEKPQ